MLSVIIPTCNRNNLLMQCLERLHPDVQQMHFNEYEIIVTDDSRENNALSLIEKNFKWVRWVQGCNKGPAANRNNGAKHAKGDWLIFIDDDCIPDDEVIKTYKEAITAFAGIRVFEGYVTVDR